MCVFCWNLVTVYMLGLLQHVWCVFMPKCVLCSETVIRCRNYVGCSELAFAAEAECLQRICDSLPKLCRLQRVNNSLPSGVFCSELAIRCQSGVVCSKSLPKLSWLQRICDSLPKLWCQQRNSFRCRTGCRRRNNFRC